MGCPGKWTHGYQHPRSQPLRSFHFAPPDQVPEVCRRAVPVAYEAMECHGGNGYAEGPMARLFRQSPLNAIWEGTGVPVPVPVPTAASRVRRETEENRRVVPDVAAGKTEKGGEEEGLGWVGGILKKCPFPPRNMRKHWLK